MMTFAFFLLGCFAGIFTWLYIDRFIPNLQQEFLLCHGDTYFLPNTR
jgi:prepilin signal peptidase PulO-like enzyme (type II secretory pathway)